MNVDLEEEPIAPVSRRRRTTLSNKDAPVEDKSLVQIALVSVAYLGIQFAWAVQIAQGSPLFVELGVTRAWVSIVWLAGPISGLFVQPIVGALGDRNKSRFGRRRPFIVAGMVFVVVAMMLLSNAADAGESFFGDTAMHRGAAIGIAVFSFWLLDLAQNTSQAPARALLIDTISEPQQPLGNSCFSLMLGIGNVLGYLASSIQWTDDERSTTRVLFIIAAAMLFITTMTTVCSTPERRHRPPPLPPNAPNVLVRIASDVWYGIRHMPKALQRIVTVQLFAWIGWFSLFLFATDWMGKNIYGGDGEAPFGSPEQRLYADGVRQGAKAMVGNAVLTICCSLVLPSVIKRLGYRLVWMSGNVMLACCLLPCVFISDKWPATIMISLCGFAWAITQTVPFALIGEITHTVKDDRLRAGVLIGVHNVFIVLPQLVDAFVLGPIVDAFGGNPGIALAIGGCAALLAAAAAHFILVPSEHAQLLDTGAALPADESGDAFASLADPTASINVPLLEDDEQQQHYGSAD